MGGRGNSSSKSGGIDASNQIKKRNARIWVK